MTAELHQSFPGMNVRRREPMHISVIICTWNRADRLDQTLARLAEVQPPSRPWEVIVVDNNCTDHTQEVIARHQDRLPMTALREPEPGLSNARNTGISVAAGDYVVWTDDDVLVDRAWLRGYESAFDRFPDVSIFGGPIRPFTETSPPDWFDTVVGEMGAGYVWALRDLGENEIALSSSLLPFGANMAFRRSVLGQRPFDARLGRKKDQLISGEESTLIRSLLEQGHTGRWVPGASVEHFVPADRMTMDYMHRWWVGRGMVEAATLPGGRFTLFGVPSWALREYLHRSLLMHYFRLRGDLCRMLPELTRRARLLGVMKGFRAGGRA